jgi:hypothetical protein
MDAMSHLKVFEAMPVLEPRSTWLIRLLSPLAEACKMPKFAVEIRPMKWDGFCAWSERDKRLWISSKLVFWSRSKLTSIYLHECAHRLLEEQKVEDHGVQFFTLLLIFHQRCKVQFFELGAEPESLMNLGFYDCAEKSHVWKVFGIEPKNWWSLQAQWAMDTAQLLASSNDDAATLSKKIPAMWREHVKQRRADIDQDTAEQIKREAIKTALKNKVSRLKTITLLLSWLVLLVFGGTLMVTTK